MYPAPGGVLAWTTAEGEVAVWNLPDDRQVARFHWVPGKEKHLALSRDQRWLAATDGEENQLAVWDLVNRERRITSEKSKSAVTCQSFLGDRPWIAAGNFNGTVDLWSLENKDVKTNWVAHREAVTAIALIPRNDQMVTVSSDGTAALWSMSQYRLVGPFARTAVAFLSAAATPDASRVAAGCADGSINIWDPQRRHQLARLTPDRPDGDPKALQFLPPNGDVLISLTEKQARVWRAPPWAEIGK
jgi:WD40 repeat protein